MNSGRLVFVLEIAPRFQADLQAGRPATLQLNIDATAMTQAGNGAVYIQQIIAQEIADRQAGRETTPPSSINLVVRARFNPNLDSGWFSSVMQVLNNVTLLTIILTGAALIREREQGTVEHLLVMPVTPVEIMLAKMVANALVILVAAVASLVLVVEWALGVPITGSLLLFVLGTAIYAFAVAALGILLGTLATTMGQFGLLAIPVFVVTQLLSGATTPMESMPIWLQWIMRIFSPTPHFVAFSQGVLYRGAGLDVVWPEIAKIIAIGAAYFAFALARFRKVIFA
jgi:ABC-2 type transport system permease protein